MEDGDDDFGDLYADVEVEAMNVAPQISQISDELDKQDGDNDKACVRIDSEYDDDDDLDIVLNSDDDNREGFTIARNNTNSRSTEVEDEDDDNLGAEVKLVGNSRSMYKYLRSQPAAYGSDLKGIGCLTAAYLAREDNAYCQQMGPQSAQRFSLPRARNILDVNIDIFEQKPWNHPGADITDYFNFGFNEDSWKHYCNQVDEYRHRGPVSSGTPPSEPDQSKEVDRRTGQAIQVEDSIFERQSSIDVRRQVDRDSDVIQITILDPDYTSVLESSNHGDVSVDDVTEHLSFSSASEDESVEVNNVDNHEIDRVRTNETIRNSEDTKESNFVAESSHEDKSPPNHGLKSYTHDRCLTELTRSVKPDYHNSEDSNKSVEKRGPDESRYHARRFGDSRKQDDRIYHERHDNPVYKNRTHKDFNLKKHCENDYIISRRTDAKRKSGEHGYLTGHNGGFLPVSDKVHYSCRQRLHAFDPYNEENISYPKSKVSSDYHGERFRGYEDLDDERFGANKDRTVFRSVEEGNYYDEERRYIEDNRMTVVNWCRDEKGQKKGDKLYFRNKIEIDEFYLEPRYYDDTDEEKFSNNYRKSKDVEFTKWEFKSPRRKKRACNLFSEVDDPFLKRDNEEFFKSYSPDGRWHGNMTPKNSFYRRHGSQREQYFESFEREDYIIDIDDHVDMRRKRRHLLSEIQREDEIMFKHEDVKFCAPRNSFLFEEVSRRKRFIYEPDLDHAEELIDDPYVVEHLVDQSGYVKELTNGQHANWCRYYKQKNEVFSGNKCIKTHGKSRKRLPLSSRKSHQLVGQVKSSKKHKKPEWAVLNMGKNDKMGRADETKAIGEGLDIEEGQIVTEEVKGGPMRAQVDEPLCHNGKSGFDSTRILEAMAKMEKRRARFNEPITVARKSSDCLIKPAVVDSNNQERPARKRRWGGK